MELTLGTIVAVIFCLYLSILTSPVSGNRKCTGEWNRHACRGGNGKRSDPSMGAANSYPPELLKQLLLRDTQQLQRMLKDTDSTAQRDELLLPAREFEEEAFNDFDDAADEMLRQQLERNTPDTEELRRYITALKIQRSLRQREANLE